MESDWSSATNWAVARGSLVNSVTFESSLSPIDEDDTDLNSTPKTPLLLQPPASDSAPCEITISFTQKHEFRQIYVRSTARLYEIYYEPNLQSGREYLTTVRCGIAAREEGVLQTIDNEEIPSATPNGSRDNLPKENLSNSGCPSTSSEDEWVEIKVRNATVLDKKDNVSSKFCSDQEKRTQDYYEATAEINDAYPCVSLTLRLLSVQCKDRVYIDEVYVFADPVDSSDSENPVVQGESSSGNSLMAMLLPTILQMSKTKATTRTQDKHTSDSLEKQNFEDSGSETGNSTLVATKVQQEENFSDSGHQLVESWDKKRASEDAVPLKSPPKVPHNESKPEFSPNNRAERALDELASRMGRIEDLFLRMEENLLRPINSIEARLHRVEEQLEVLINKPKNSELLPGTRFVAPNFSFMESDSNSFYQGGNDYPYCDELESNNKDIHNDVSDSVNAIQLLPTLVFTAPEFSNCDDDEENHASDEVSDSLVDEPRAALSIDDVLASALAGFVSSIAVRPQNFTPTLSIKAPEFSNEEDVKVDQKSSPGAQYEVGTDGIEITNDSPSNVSRLYSVDHSEKIAETIDGESQHHHEGEKEDEPELIDEKDEPELINEKNEPELNNEKDEQPCHDKALMDSCQIAEEVENRELSIETNILVPNKTENRDQFLLHQTDDIDSDTTEQKATPNGDSIAAVEVKKGPNKDILLDMLEFSHATSVVNFETPVLDVKFVSQDSGDSNSPLEALFPGLQESKSETTHVEEKSDTPPSDEHHDLISVEDGEQVGPASENQFYLDFDYYSLHEPLNREEETPPDSTTSSSHEMYVTSLI
ncbi:hypothetical protein UlMin_007318 [Ulmus minor]